MTDQGLIILKRVNGPTSGLVTVTVDAPGYKQAEIVVDAKFAGTADEEIMLRRILEERRRTNEALKAGDV